MKHFGLSENIQQKKFYLFFVILGVLIVLGNLFYARSLWLDEAMLALNIVDRNFAELLMPLDMVQVAPIGFLYVEKVFSIIFNEADWSFRIFPMCCFFGAIFLFYKLLLKLKFSANRVLYYVAFFSLNYTLLSYATELKQYACDVFFTILLVLLTLNYVKHKGLKSGVLIAFAGAVAPWFSNIAVIILFTAGIFILIKERNRIRSYRFQCFIPIVTWLISFGFYYVFFIHKHPNNREMVDYWQEAFLPLNVLSKDFYFFIYDQIKMIFGYILPSKSLWIIPFVISIVGVIQLYREKHKTLLYFLSIPLLVHLLLSAFQLYPFAKKFIIYLSPFIIIIFVTGIITVIQLCLKCGIKKKEFYLTIPLLLYMIPPLVTFPLEREEIKPCMEILAAKLTLNDNLYIYYGAIPAFEFYKKDYQIVCNQTFFGEENRLKSEQYLLDLDDIDFPNWLLFSHDYKQENGKSEIASIISDLEKKGFSVVYQESFKGTSVIQIKLDTSRIEGKVKGVLQ